MHKLLTVTLAAVLLLLTAAAPAFAQDDATRLAAPREEQPADLDRLLTELRPFIAEGRLAVAVYPAVAARLSAGPDEQDLQQPWATLAAPDEDGSDEGIVCFEGSGCGCSNFNSTTACSSLKWACNLVGGKYEVDQSEPYEIGSCYLPK